jgi:hypothetical protein
VFRKLNIQSSRELVRYAVRNKLLEPCWHSWARRMRPSSARKRSLDGLLSRETANLEHCFSRFGEEPSELVAKANRSNAFTGG